MLYPIYVQVGDKKHAHGIEFPGFSGLLFSGGSLAGH